MNRPRAVILAGIEGKNIGISSPFESVGAPCYTGRQSSPEGLSHIPLEYQAHIDARHLLGICFHNGRNPRFRYHRIPPPEVPYEAMISGVRVVCLISLMPSMTTGTAFPDAALPSGRGFPCVLHQNEKELDNDSGGSYY
jgi:hypothetical protein